MALLITPALASATCNSVTNFTDASNDHDWFNAANWSGGVPADNESACIPVGKTPTIAATGAIVSDLFVEGGLTVDNFGELTVTGNGLDGVSTISGSLTIQGGGTVNLKNSQTTIGSDVQFANSGTLNVSNGFLILSPNTDLLSSTVGNVVNVNVGAQLTIDSAGSAGPAQIKPVLNVNGVVTNTGDVDVIGGGSGAGDWKLGSGDPEPTVTISNHFQLDGSVSDLDSGGLGHLVIANGGDLTQAPFVASTLEVEKLDITGTGGTDGIDISPGTGTSSVHIGSLEQSGGKFEVNENASIDNYTLHNNTLTSGSGHAVWTIGYLHWGGGTLSGGAGGTTYNVGALALFTLTGDVGNRVTDNSGVTLNVASFDNASPMTLGGIALGAADSLVIAYDARLALGDAGGAGPNITGTGTIVNHGIIDKSDGNAASTINPTLQTIDGQLWVSGPSATLKVAGPIDALSGGVLRGNYIVEGELDVGGPVTQLDGQFQFGAFGKITNGGASIYGTLTSNSAATTITVQSAGIQLNQPFTNNGTIDVQAGWSLTANAAYTQAAGGVTKVNGTLNAAAGVTLTGGGTLEGSGTVVGNVSNPAGSLAPGNSPGQLTINGNYTQSGTGILFEEINGPVAGTGYDQLVVNGSATLGGLLVLQGNGYAPPNGQPFDIVTGTPVVGDFAGTTQFPSTTWFDAANSGAAYRLTANSVSIGDATVNEGNSGTTAASFTIALGQASNAPVAVDWATQDGSATFGSDYAAANGTVNFAPGETAKTVTVAVTGDTAVEPDENFAVNLSNPVGTRIRDGQGVGTITNDDSPQATVALVAPGDIDGFLIAPPPVQGKKVNVQPLGGKVLVKLPGKASFIPLPDTEQVPVGTIVDATAGRVRLFSVGKGGRVQFADFYEGVFQVVQKPGQSLTIAKLVGGSFSGCPSARTASLSTTKRKKSANSSVRHLWGDGKGDFQTQGRYASASIRGTRWLTDDRCNGTLVRVAVGAVTVRDLTLKKSFALKAPKKYLAPAVKPKKKR